ncbi:hypothetical protein [Planctomicrobium piriforme]|uniref:NADH:quinone oxidoreductase/Mrp antiporter membrane subunit domain-containing protein n=1 Tax=Planctomicrobium piriforme TaxID=1576369 RepID=A0A1I3B804_9PLAN|nr:hypothetical protein [Planctomicrobium piriforme]SFH58455.1 hypothetical protein SAMN05421753_101295 [Planctomicrobium piriforme]
MLHLLIIAVLLLVLACVVKMLGSGRARLGQGLIATGSLIALGLLVLQALAKTASATPDWLTTDAVSLAAAAVAIFSCLIVSLLDSSPTRNSAACWSGGLLVLGGIASTPLLLWGSLQFSVLALLFYGRTQSDKPASLPVRHASVLTGCVLFAAGMLLQLKFPDTSAWGVCGTAMLVCGLGGMLRWFPFPRVATATSDGDASLAVIGQRLLPTMTAAVVLWRLAELHSFSQQQGFVLAIAAMFTLTICSARLLQESLLSRRKTLTLLSTFSFLIVAVCLQNWELTHVARDWASSSNLPTGRTLFISILVSETAALLLSLCGQRLLQANGDNSDVAETLAGAMFQKPLASLPLLVGVFSQAGVAPLPGFWWRFGLIAACLLPHRQSTLTRVMEGDNGFSLLAVVLLVLIIINSLGQLRLVQRVLFDEPFRVRDGRVNWGVRLATGVALAALLFVASRPLSLENKPVAEPASDVAELSLSVP